MEHIIAIRHRRLKNSCAAPPGDGRRQQPMISSTRAIYVGILNSDVGISAYQQPMLPAIKLS